MKNKLKIYLQSNDLSIFTLCLEFFTRKALPNFATCFNELWNCETVSRTTCHKQLTYSTNLKNNLINSCPTATCPFQPAGPGVWEASASGDSCTLRIIILNTTFLVSAIPVYQLKEHTIPFVREVSKLYNPFFITGTPAELIPLFLRHGFSRNERICLYFLYWIYLGF